MGKRTSRPDIFIHKMPWSGFFMYICTTNFNSMKNKMNSLKQIIATGTIMFVLCIAGMGAQLKAESASTLGKNERMASFDNRHVRNTRSDTLQFKWKGKWIVVFDNQNATNTWSAFRKEASIDSVPKVAVARIATDSKYWLWVNGQLVVFEGGLKRGPNPTDTYYDEVDIAPYLVKGRNVIAIQTCYFGKDGFSHISSGKAGLLFDCREPGLEIVSDKSWQGTLLHAFGTVDGPQPNFRLSESNVCYDARKSIGEWMLPTFDSRGLTGVRVFGEAGCYPWNKLHKRPIPLFKDYGLKPYVRQEVHGDTLICELPYNCQFTPYLKIGAPAGKRVRMFSDIYVLFDPTTTIYGEYITRNGVQEYEQQNWINGNKMYYILPKEVEIIDVKFRETGYQCDFSGSFHSSNTFLNALWTKARRTLYVTMRDNFMDCPDRERAQWAGDAVNESLEAYYALSVSSHLLVKKWLSETVGWQRPDGSMFAPVPAGNWFDELPGQVLATIGEYGFWYYYLYTGDKETLRDLYPGIKKYLSLWEKDEKGIMKFRTGDWTWGDWGDHKDMVLLFNAWYYIAVQGMQKAAQALGYTDDATSYQEFLKYFKESFNRHFWTGKSYRHPDYKGRTDDRVQALAVVSGLADSDKYPALRKVFLTEEHASPYMEKYVFEAMMKMGDVDKAIKRHHKRFGHMINEPYTTLFEGWEIKGFGGGTINHGWSGGGLVICSQYLCGITPLTPAFRTFRIFPQPGSLKEAEAVVPTVNGTIRSMFKVKGRSFRLEAHVPEGTTALIGIPRLRKYRKVCLNGQIAWQKGKFLPTGMAEESASDEDYIIFRCKPGSYIFEAS